MQWVVAGLRIHATGQFLPIRRTRINTKLVITSPTNVTMDINFTAIQKSIANVEDGPIPLHANVNPYIQQF